MSDSKATTQNLFPESFRRGMERAIEEAIHPKGMSVHSGMARVNASHLVNLLARYDQSAALLQSRDATIEGLRAALVQLLPLMEMELQSYRRVGKMPSWLPTLDLARECAALAKRQGG